METIKIVPKDPKYIPYQAHPSDACFDLVAAEYKLIFPLEREAISCGFSMALPDGYAAFLWPRSGLAVRHGVHVGAGVIDAHYRGDVAAVLFNLGPETLEISEGDRIAQMFICPVPEFEFMAADSLDDSDRGSSGFGSTGA